MTRKERHAAKHAAGLGKGRPTPRQVKSNRSWDEYAPALRRRLRRSRAKNRVARQSRKANR